MAKTKVFLSYDYEHDLDMKNNLIAQSKLQDSPFAINDLSLKEKSHDWQQRVRKSIEECDVFVVLLGKNTYLAMGVLRELKMAKQMGKKRFQLRKKGTQPKELKAAGNVVAWKWKNLKKYLTLKSG
jgi:hypothetical protein